MSELERIAKRAFQIESVNVLRIDRLSERHAVAYLVTVSPDLNYTERVIGWYRPDGQGYEMRNGKRFKTAGMSLLVWDARVRQNWGN